MQTFLGKYWLYILASAVLIIIGLIFGWRLFRPAPPVQQVYHAAEQLAPNVIKAEVKPDANAKPIAPLKRGEVLTRKIIVTARAKVPTVDIGGSVTVETKVEQLAQMVKAAAPVEEIKKAEAEIVKACQQEECPPVEITIDLTREPDGQQRAIVTSDNGEILGAMDIPRENVEAPPSPRNWGIGPSYDPFKKTIGAVIERRIHEILPLTIGGELHQTEEGRVDRPGVRVWALYNF